MCTLHYQQCGSGKQVNKALWMFNLLSDCNTVAEIHETKNKYYPQMKHTDINVLQELFDYQQYSTAQCEMEPRLYTYH